jgi:hypothetical protein
MHIHTHMYEYTYLFICTNTGMYIPALTDTFVCCTEMQEGPSDTGRPVQQTCNNTHTCTCTRKLGCISQHTDIFFCTEIQEGLCNRLATVLQDALLKVCMYVFIYVCMHGVCVCICI